MRNAPVPRNDTIAAVIARFCDTHSCARLRKLGGGGGGACQLEIMGPDDFTESGSQEAVTMASRRCSEIAETWLSMASAT